MKNILAITKKELYSYFYSPFAYIVLSIFLVLTGVFFSSLLFQITRYLGQQGGQLVHSDVFRFLFSNLTVVLVFFIPFLTARILAEEKKLGTLELLLTKPVTDFEVVMGKFLGVFLFYMVALGLTFLELFILMKVGNPDLRTIFSGYLGMLLLGGSIISLGMLASSVTENQIVAGILGAGFALLFWLISVFASHLGALSGFFRYLGLLEHFEDFSKGVIDFHHVIFYLSYMIFFLFLTIRVAANRRWN